MPVRPPLRAGALSSQSPISCIRRIAQIRLPCFHAHSSSRCCMRSTLPIEWVCDAAEALTAKLPGALGEVPGLQLQRHALRIVAATAPSQAHDQCHGTSQGGQAGC